MGLLAEFMEERFREDLIRRGLNGRFVDKPGSGKLPATPVPSAPGAGPTDGVMVPQASHVKRKLSEGELANAVGEGPWSKRAREVVPDLDVDGSGKDTEAVYRPGGGPYTPERAALHGRIIGLLVRHAQPHDHPRAVFLAGGPASGKSSLLTTGQVKLPGDAVDVNPDIVKTMLPEYQALVAAGDPLASSKVHEESSHIAKMVMAVAVQRKHHVTVDGVGGGGPGKFAGKVRAAIGAGFETEVNYVSIDTEEAERRSIKRAKRSGRLVPTGYLRAAHREVSERFEEVVALPGVRVRVFDNNGAKPVLAAEMSPAMRKVRVVNRRAYEAFVAKARKKAGQDVG